MTGPRIGSRVHMLASMQPGDRHFLEAPPGRLQPFMQQVNTDIHRAGKRGAVTQAHMLGVDPRNRTVVDLVVLTHGQ